MSFASCSRIHAASCCSTSSCGGGSGAARHYDAQYRQGNGVALIGTRISNISYLGRKIMGRRDWETRTVTCMANPRRMARVSKQIEREIGALFVSDKVVQEAICPERKRGIDDGLSALASVTEVEVSNDLQVAKVYLSIYSDAAGKAMALRGLQRLEGYVRKHIGRQIRLRLTPEIRFILDDSIEKSERVLSLLKQVERINSGNEPPTPLVLPYDEEEDDIILHQEAPISGVDLGFYDDHDDEQAGVEDQDDVSLSDSDVQEMLMFFKQDSSEKARPSSRSKKYKRKN